MTDAELDERVRVLSNDDLAAVRDNQSDLTWYRQRAIDIRMAREILDLRTIRENLSEMIERLAAEKIDLLRQIGTMQETIQAYRFNDPDGEGE